ncbi:uncharacterized protein LY89DRAFT_554124, partial [Mollisia scopiformis]
MLPTSLAGSYQQYKQDTTVFTTWLSKAAIACGYEIPSEHLQKPTPTAQTKAQTPSKRLKGKARKEAAEIPKVETGKPDTRPIIRYVVPTKELIKQAEVVAKQGKRVLPQGLRRVANRAIDARRRCADWFRTSKVKNEHSDEAIQLVRQNEEEILASAPNLFNKKRSYNTIAIVIFYANAFSEGYDPAEKMRSNDSLKPTPFDDFIYLSTARILMKMDFFSKMPDNIAYPAPIWPLRMSFISRPELLAMPYIKHKEKEDVILSQHIIDHDMY